MIIFSCPALAWTYVLFFLERKNVYFRKQKGIVEFDPLHKGGKKINVSSSFFSRNE